MDRSITSLSQCHRVWDCANNRQNSYQLLNEAQLVTNKRKSLLTSQCYASMNCKYILLQPQHSPKEQLKEISTAQIANCFVCVQITLNSNIQIINLMKCTSRAQFVAEPSVICNPPQWSTSDRAFKSFRLMRK